jgi:hypothetical protein
MGIVVTVDVDEKQSVAADGQETSQAQVETLNWLWGPSQCMAAATFSLLHY